MREPIITVKDIAKEYQLGTIGSGSLKEAITAGVQLLNPFKKTEKEESSFWALKDINFDVEQGEVVGIIGKNGAGKSTLLKVLSQITRPTTGQIRILGRVSSLLEVGTGFHPELTGRENIFLNGSILGMTRVEIKRKFDDIVEFSGIEKFLDTPVKRYSSGMYVRLAFSVAAHLEPEVLVVDEVLAVGDADFQKRCLGKMRSVAKQGRTVLFVSHNMGAVKSLCSRCILLNQGRVQFDGDVDQAISIYFDTGANEEDAPLSSRTDREGTGVVRLTDIGFVNALTGKRNNSIISGSPAMLEVSYETSGYSGELLNSVHFGFSIFNAYGQFVTVLNSKMAAGPWQSLPTSGKVHCYIEKMPLMYGKFHMMAAVMIDHDVSDKVENALSFVVEEGDYYESSFPNARRRQGVYIPQKWSVANTISNE